MHSTRTSQSINDTEVMFSALLLAEDLSIGFPTLYALLEPAAWLLEWEQPEIYPYPGKRLSCHVIQTIFRIGGCGVHESAPSRCLWSKWRCAWCDCATQGRLEIPDWARVLVFACFFVGCLFFPHVLFPETCSGNCVCLLVKKHRTHPNKGTATVHNKWLFWGPSDTCSKVSSQAA